MRTGNKAAGSGLTNDAREPNPREATAAFNISTVTVAKSSASRISAGGGGSTKTATFYGDAMTNDRGTELPERLRFLSLVVVGMLAVAFASSARAQAIKSFPIPSDARLLTGGPDGNLWYLDGSDSANLGRMATSGAVTTLDSSDLATDYFEDFEGAANPAFRFSIIGSAAAEVVDAGTLPGISGVSGRVLYYTQQVLSYNVPGSAGVRIDVPPDTKILSFDMASKLLPQIPGVPFCDYESAVVYSHSAGFSVTATPPTDGPLPLHPNCPAWISGRFEITRPEGYRTDYYIINLQHGGHDYRTALLAAALAFDNFHIVAEPCLKPTRPELIGLPSAIPAGGYLTVSWTPADNLPSDGNHHYVLQVAKNPSFAPYIVFKSTPETFMTFNVPESDSDYTLWLGVWSYVICTVTDPWNQSPAFFKTVRVIGGTRRPKVSPPAARPPARAVSPRP